MKNIEIQRRETYRQTNARRRAALRAHSIELGIFLRRMGIEPATIERAIRFASKDPESTYDFEPRQHRRRGRAASAG